jgi:hypothetical protein
MVATMHTPRDRYLVTLGKGWYRLGGYPPLRDHQCHAALTAAGFSREDAWHYMDVLKREYDDGRAVAQAHYQEKP